MFSRSFERCPAPLAFLLCLGLFFCLTGGRATAQDSVVPPPANQQPPPATSQPPAPSPAPIAAPTTQHAKAKQTATGPDPLDAKMSLGDGHNVWRPTRKQIGMSVAQGVTVGAVFPAFSVDPVKARAYLTKIAPYVRRAAVPARIRLSGKYAHENPLAVTSSSVPVPIKILPAEPAAALDVDGSVTAIQNAIAADPGETHIVLATVTHAGTSPDYDNAKFSGIDSRIAHFVTHFNPYERGRTQTVRLAISLVDDHLVQPGETFSLNQTVGERTAERGFGEGIVFVDGHLDKQLGGGMCQVATTLFNAVLLANMKVVERHQHVRTVPYVHPGQDATVYWGQKDFKFLNNSAVPIYISYKTTDSHAICDLYGKAEPTVKVSVDDSYRRLGPRHYSAVLRRYVTVSGKTTVDYQANSEYDWTPRLDYTF